MLFLTAHHYFKLVPTELIVLIAALLITATRGNLVKHFQVLQKNPVLEVNWFVCLKNYSERTVLLC